MSKLRYLQPLHLQLVVLDLLVLELLLLLLREDNALLHRRLHLLPVLRVTKGKRKEEKKRRESRYEGGAR